MRRTGLALALAAVIGAACGAQTSASPAVDAAPSTPADVPDGCPLVGTGLLDGIVARAVSGLDDTTDGDGWSRACAWMTAPGGSGEPTLLMIQIGWRGSLHEYSAERGAKPIAGLADEAYALDAGDRIALRSGELVAIVTYPGGATLATEAVAREVAAQLPG